MFKFIIALVVSCMLLQAAAFSPMRSSTAVRTAKSSAVSMSVFDVAVKKWSEEYPAPFSVGWGPTTKAERWNGRHAMFGWVALIATGYAKSHGLIPNPESVLDMKDWGTLAYTYGGSITNERAVILVGHLHLLLFSVCAAIAPLSFQDKLYLQAGEEPEPAAGLIPKIVPGLTMEAELLNGRLAMLGLTVTVLVSVVNQTPILDVINTGLGGMLL
ncbi:hypothetical protein B484DRAFT_448478 [Ochromonadaceae sp. CCMP2298]|nr:hypothetical protein B484DRAFT_448478 [Ochromonadaceae sp. CCMP2298]